MCVSTARIVLTGTKKTKMVMIMVTLSGSLIVVEELLVYSERLLEARQTDL